MARPLVGHRELHLDRRSLTEFGEDAPIRSGAASAANRSPLVPAPTKTSAALRVLAPLLGGWQCRARAISNMTMRTYEL
jgi:hypothetical protein